MDFERIEGLAPLREAGRRFAEREIAPGVESRDRQRACDPALLTRMAQAGLLGAMLPTVHGGRGLGALETTALLEGFGEGGEDAGLALAAGVHDFLCAVPLWKLGTEAQRRRYLPRMASGEWVGGLSLLELEGGAATPGLRAVRQGRGWRLQGTKAWVVNAPIAHHVLLTAVTGPTGSLSAFLIDRETPGLRLGAPADTSGLRTCPLAELTLEDCEVPEESLLGTEGAALTELLPLLLALERGLLLAPWVGIMRALTRRAISAARRPASPTRRWRTPPWSSRASRPRRVMPRRAGAWPSSTCARRA
jgi:alkylation response protein AidB-like acyl-CoA dehydrogenase